MFEDACGLAGYLLREPILNESTVRIEKEVMIAELRLLVMYCRISQGSSIELSQNSNMYLSLPILSKGKGAIENCPFQIGLNVVKATNSLSVHFSSSKCSRELSARSIALRNTFISFTARRLMTELNGWVGLVSEMKMFGKLTSELSRQITFSSR